MFLFISKKKLKELINKQNRTYFDYIELNLYKLTKDIECISNSFESQVKSYIDKCITDINDLKADYLKRYLEVQTNNMSLSINRFEELHREIEERLSKLEQ